MTKNCPLCGESAAVNVANCDCGYTFSSAAFSGNSDTGHDASVQPQSRSAGIWGIAVAIMGLFVMAYAYFLYDASVASSGGQYGLPERINNNGLLQRQLMLFVFGGVATLTGTLIWVAGTVQDALRERTRGH